MLVFSLITNILFVFPSFQGNLFKLTMKIGAYTYKIYNQLSIWRTFRWMFEVCWAIRGVGIPRWVISNSISSVTYRVTKIENSFIGERICIWNNISKKTTCKGDAKDNENLHDLHLSIRIGHHILSQKPSLHLTMYLSH